MIRSLLLSFVVSAVLVRLLANGAFLRDVLDKPNERSLHVAPVPRTGGIGLCIGCAAGWLAFANGALPFLLVVVGGLWALSIADDVLDLPIRARLVAQVVAALAFLSVYFEGHPVVFLIALPTLVWMTNLYNFMDGSDGLAGGMTVIGFGAYAIAAYLAGAQTLAGIAASIVGAALGFLLWNFHPARIFMGDAGSIPLGFLSAAIGIAGWQSGVWPFWFPAVVFSPFIMDATVTLLKRYLRGEKLSAAHRTHYYQRLVQMGYGHKHTALIAYALMLVVAALALTARTAPPSTVVALLSVLGAVYVFGLRFVDRLWVRHRAGKGRMV